MVMWRFAAVAGHAARGEAGRVERAADMARRGVGRRGAARCGMARRPLRADPAPRARGSWRGRSRRGTTRPPRPSSAARSLGHHRSTSVKLRSGSSTLCARDRQMRRAAPRRRRSSSGNARLRADHVLGGERVGLEAREMQSAGLFRCSRQRARAARRFSPVPKPSSAMWKPSRNRSGRPLPGQKDVTRLREPVLQRVVRVVETAARRERSRRARGSRVWSLMSPAL